MELSEAISQTELTGWGTIISCIPGQLAYYDDECGERRILLAREKTNSHEHLPNVKNVCNLCLDKRREKL